MTKRDARQALREGRVTVDGQPITRFAHILTDAADVALDGVSLVPAVPVVYLMNKPPKHLTQLADGPERPGLGQYLPDDAAVFPVGRLDYNTEGALFFTNDGHLARRVLHPHWALPKVYNVKIRGHLEADDPGLEAMRQGISLSDVTYQPALVTLGPRRTRATWVSITISEGKNRQIRRMCQNGGFQIVKLRRVAIGPIQLGELNKRCVRRLSDDELSTLKVAVGMDPADQ